MTAHMKIRLTPEDLAMSPDDVLGYLQNLLILSSSFGHSSRHRVAELAANNAGRPDNGDIRRELSFAEVGEKQASAARIAMALMEVLTHPDFGAVQRIHRHTSSEDLRTCQCLCIVSDGQIPPTHGYAETILGAILRAHTAIQEQQSQEGAPPSATKTGE